MTDVCKRRQDCRLCSSANLDLVLELTPTPPANAFVGANQLHVEQQCFPLDLFLCCDCGHVQLTDIVDPEILFRNYVYVSGTSPVFRRHFKLYAQHSVGLLGRKPRLVVDLGSNDGTLLRFFQEKGSRVLGVDPAVDIARRATEAGIPTLPNFFDRKLAKTIVDEHGQADLVCANNVFAHVDDLGAMTDAVREILSDDGLFVFEVSYLLDVVDKTLFDTIYHEHLSYHSVGPLVPFFRRRGLELICVERVDTHGGSLRCIVAPAGSREVDDSVSEAVRLEVQRGIARPETLRDFATAIEQRQGEFDTALATFKSEGALIAGFGAPAKATTLMYHFGLDESVIAFIVDDSPLKQGLHTPGRHIPVLPSSELYDRGASVAVVLAWNFASPIMRNHAKFLDRGGRFVVPLPAVEVYSR